MDYNTFKTLQFDSIQKYNLLLTSQYGYFWVLKYKYNYDIVQSKVAYHNNTDPM